MIEEKMIKLAKTIVDYSIDLQEGENVRIDFTIDAKEFVRHLIKEIKRKKANVYLNLTDAELTALAAEDSSSKRIDTQSEYLNLDVKVLDAYIHVRGNNNDYERKNINTEILKEMGKKFKNATDIRVNDKKWVLLDYPTSLDAYKNELTTEEFKHFAFDVMTVDYKKMGKDVEPLKEIMEKTDKVRITAPNTDLTFSIRGLPAIPCVGERNIPDGECYSAPVRDSVNGTITYNTPSPYQGSVYNHVSLTFKDGKIINATCDEDNNKLNEIFDTDEGARYVGEFALGFNPQITKPMGNILYDEKIMGSLHFTPGKCYQDCNNGNHSSIHWDMVLIQTEEFGGGAIYFDDILIRKDGEFVLEELKHLNYK